MIRRSESFDKMPFLALKNREEQPLRRGYMKDVVTAKKEEREEDFADKIWGFLIGSSFAVLKIVLILFLAFLAILGLLWLLGLLFPYLIEIAKNAVKKALGIG